MDWDQLGFLGQMLQSRLRDSYKRVETLYFAFEDQGGAGEVLEQCMTTDDFNLHGDRLSAELLNWRKRYTARASSMVSLSCAESFSHL